MKYKDKRHTKILEIISNTDIGTQDELTACLNAAGIKATQATVSRDIKELHLIKILTGENTYKYSQNTKEAVMRENSLNVKSKSIMRDSIVSVKNAQNMVVVKCYSGMAQAACAAIDILADTRIIGSLAGDDTIFLVAENTSEAKEIVSEITDIVS